MSFQLSKIIAPQFVSNAAAALSLTVDGAGTTAAAVPVLTSLSLWTCRFTNVSGAPVTLTVYRGTVAAANKVINAISIPVATANNPYFAWDPGYQLAAGESIWALAGTANALVVTGDGGIST
jgi:hypothetical protein